MSKNTIDRIRRIIENSVFCYDKLDGQGLIDKNKCDCYNKKSMSCDAYHDKQRFHERYQELESEGFNRSQIIEKLEIEFKDSSWYKYNVIK